LILVSGATGFLGAHLVCKLLSHGKHVRAMYRSVSSLAEFEYIYRLYFKDDDPKKRLQWFESDILDIPSLELAFDGVSEVYHCAAMVSFLQKDRNQMMKVNEEGTANMVNMALAKGVAKFCHVSSIAALGREKSGVEITESSKWSESSLNSNYAISKHKAELQAWRGQEEGLNMVIVNPGVIIGAGDWKKGSCKLFDIVWRELPFYTDGVNGYVDVTDVASAMFELMEKQLFGERYILVGANIENSYLMHTAAQLLGKRKAFIKVNKTLAELAWRVASIGGLITGKSPSITKETARASLKKYYYSSKKISDKINFSFTPIEKTFSYICTEFKQSTT
jgi:nucleoside-diphosphate-sugar epimerase